MLSLNMNEDFSHLEETPRQQRARTLRAAMPLIAIMMALSAGIGAFTARYCHTEPEDKPTPVPPPVELGPTVTEPVAVTNTEPDRYECVVRAVDASMSNDRDGLAAIGWDMDRPGQQGFQIKSVVFNPNQGVRGQYVFVFERRCGAKDKDQLSDTYLARWKAWMDNNPQLKKEVLAAVEREQAISDKKK